MTTPGTTTWHAAPDILHSYVEGRLDAVLGASLERHLDGCASCRAAIRPLTDLPMLDRAWSDVRAAVEDPPLPWLIRLARRVGLPEPTGILLAATASLRVAWVSSAIVALGFAAAATTFSSASSLWPFLLVAPLVPVLGVAAAYGPSDDPFETLAVTTPYGRTRLVLTRTVAVLVTSVPVACLLGLTMPGPVWVAAAWLGPALTMLPLLLAAASFVGPRLAASVLALLWSGLVIGASRTAPPTWPVEASQQAVYAGVAVAATVVLLVRSHRTRRIGVVL